MSGKNLSLTLRVWRQTGTTGKFEEYKVTDISEDSSFLEMMDILNEQIIKNGGEPVAFDHDCREGICGMCSMQINGVSGLCITKLDVMDGMSEVTLGVGYDTPAGRCDVLPFGADAVAQCTPIYETMPGWSGSTQGVRQWADLPPQAQRYLNRLSEVVGAPIAMVSTGADRDDTILLDHPFGN